MDTCVVDMCDMGVSRGDDLFEYGIYCVILLCTEMRRRQQGVAFWVYERSDKELESW